MRTANLDIHNRIIELSSVLYRGINAISPESVVHMGTGTLPGSNLLFWKLLMIASNRQLALPMELGGIVLVISPMLGVSVCACKFMSSNNKSCRKCSFKAIE